MPVRLEDGSWSSECVLDVIPAEVFSMLAYYNDWDRGIHPVSTGEAPWLPRQFRQAMHSIKAAVDEQNELARQRLEAKRRPKGG